MDLFLSLPVKPGKTFKVKCKIFSKDVKKFRPVTLIIDTGASITSITRNVISAALDYDGIQKGNTPKRAASGLVYLDNVRVSKIEIAGALAVSNIKVDILEWEDSEIAGVIGMDILSRLHFHSDTKIFRLQSKPFWEVVEI